MQSSNPQPRKKQSRKKQSRTKQPLDIVATRVLALLCVVILGMLLLGSQALPKVREFSWANKAVSADDVAFLLTFTQPVDAKSVEENLKVEPELFGKFSWAGRRMAYTLPAPAPYGQSYDISLPVATALSGQSGFEPFETEFHTRDRSFAYIGVEGEEKGRLVLFNLTRKGKTLLTPVGQTVLDFRPYPGRDRILYSAVPDQSKNEALPYAQLYTITTGLGDIAEPPPAWQIWKRNNDIIAAGEIETILDNQEYQNLKFDLSPNGEVIVVQRVNQENPADFGPWVLAEGKAPRKLKTEPGGDFRIAPDSASLLLQQGEGTAIISLSEEEPENEDEANTAADELLDFLPDYGLTLDIASDGTAAALVNFNQDDPDKQFTQSLFWVSNRGEEKPLLETDGSILSAQFNENNEILYCLVNRLVEGEAEEEYLVMPYLTAINIESGKEEKLLEMPPQPEITVSLAPDGLAILFDEALGSDSQQATEDKENEQASTSIEATHRLWLLPLFSTLEERLDEQPIPLPPTELEIAGQQPVWLP